MGAVFHTATRREAGGTWTLRWSVDPTRVHMLDRTDYRLTAAFTPTGATRATRVVKRDRLSLEDCESFDPSAAWATALAADHRHAHALREMKESRS